MFHEKNLLLHFIWFSKEVFLLAIFLIQTRRTSIPCCPVFRFPLAWFRMAWEPSFADESINRQHIQDLDGASPVLIFISFPSIYPGLGMTFDLFIRADLRKYIHHLWLHRVGCRHQEVSSRTHKYKGFWSSYKNVATKLMAGMTGWVAIIERDLFWSSTIAASKNSGPYRQNLLQFQYLLLIIK